MIQKEWFQGSLRRLLVDMHIPDWNDEFLRDFDSEYYAEMMALGKVDTAEIYTCSCLGLCYWPTKIGFRHRGLRGRDFVGETIEACRKRGVRTQLYMNVWNRAAYDAHPEWRIILADGLGTCEHSHFRYGQCCTNRGYQEYFLALVDELNRSYETPGLWIDMVGNRHYCYCPECEARFRKETGYPEIPRIADWTDPAFIAYVDCRKNWLGEFAAKIRATVHRRTPERTVTLQTADLYNGRFGGVYDQYLDATDFLTGDFVGDQLEQSYICKLFSALSRKRPIEFMTPRCETLEHHTTTRSEENLTMRAYAALANQASFTLIDAIDPRGTLDRRFYETASKVNGTYQQYEHLILPDSEPVADVAIYHNQDSCIDWEHSPMQAGELEDLFPVPFAKTRIKLVESLQHEHRLFSFVSGTDAAALDRFKLIILSDCTLLSDAECDALAAYVKRGGRLYASYRTSLYDPAGGIRKDFRLAECLGIHYAGEKTHPVTYITPAADDTLPGVTRDYPLMLNSAQAVIAATPDAEVLGTLTLPISAADEIVKFGSAISNPPMREKGTPALVRHKFGRGKTLYVAGDLEGIGLDLHKKVFAALIGELSDSVPRIATNAPTCVELTLFKQPCERRFLLSCLNLPAELPPVPVRNIEIRLSLDGLPPVVRVGRGAEDASCEYAITGNTLTLKLSELECFEVFTLHY